MRKTSIVLLISALALGAFAAPSEAKKKKKTRTAEASYVLPTPGVAGAAPPCEAEPVGCATFDVKAGERFVELEITDALGQPAYASVYVFGYTDGSDAHDHICASSDGTLPLLSGLDKLVVVLEGYGGALSGCPGPVTEGTVTATFSNVP